MTTFLKYFKEYHVEGHIISRLMSGKPDMKIGRSWIAHMGEIPTEIGRSWMAHMGKIPN